MDIEDTRQRLLAFELWEEVSDANNRGEDIELTILNVLQEWLEEGRIVDSHEMVNVVLLAAQYGGEE